MEQLNDKVWVGAGGLELGFLIRGVVFRWLKVHMEDVRGNLSLMAVGGRIWEGAWSMSVSECDQGWGSVAVLTQ